MQPAVMKPTGRIAAFDNLRAFVTLLVVLHHSVLAYVHFGHFDRLHYLSSSAPVVDADRWTGFDVLVLFNDSYFMPLMFLLSGLFVWPGLDRKGPGAYWRGRLRRLLLPFLLAALTLIPIAYYPSFHMTGADAGFGRYWFDAVTTGPWPSGPPWFLPVLLAFDGAAALIYRRLGRHKWSCPSWLETPLHRWVVLVVISSAVFLPPLFAFGPARWLTLGPFAISASRAGLYAAYFIAGVIAGRCRLLDPDGALPRQWCAWAASALALFVVLLAVQLVRLRGGVSLPPALWLGLYGVTLAPFCAAAAFALIALFLRFPQRPPLLWAALSANAYGIYLLHYPVVTWLQYALLNIRTDAVLKASFVFVVATLVSWAGSAALRPLTALRR
jgi:peptidoglycan/LPS O-acetylase OafA/YrhL